MKASNAAIAKMAEQGISQPKGTTTTTTAKQEDKPFAWKYIPPGTNDKHLKKFNKRCITGVLHILRRLCIFWNHAI